MPPERTIEDHEKVCDALSHWPRGHNNSVTFKNNPEKYYLLQRPQVGREGRGREGDRREPLGVESGVDWFATMLCLPWQLLMPANHIYSSVNTQRSLFTEEQKKTVILKVSSA